jgi:hypothetical protein
MQNDLLRKSNLFSWHIPCSIASYNDRDSQTGKNCRLSGEISSRAVSSSAGNSASAWRRTRPRRYTMEAVMMQRTRLTLRRRCDSVRSKIANSLVGSDVSLMAGPNSVVHGIVSAVKIESGKPKLMVAGMSFDLDQVVVAIPPMLAS